MQAGISGADAPTSAGGEVGEQEVVPSASQRELIVTPDDAKDMLKAIATDVVAAALRRAEYQALKVLAWRFPHGTHITAMSISQVEHHAVYASSEEVIHRAVDGSVVSDAWIAFLLKYPRWRVLAWPSSSAHGDEILDRARRRLGEKRIYSELLNNSEHFVKECYTGSASSTKVNAGAATWASCAATSSATGAAVATPFAYSTTTVYTLGIIPWGTTVVFSSGVVVAGAAVGAAVGTVIVAPTYWAWRRSAREASLGRLPFCLLNQANRHLTVSTYHLSDTYRWMAVVGMAGQSSGNLAPQNILELDPPHDAEEFQVEVAFGGPPPETWVGSAVSTVASAARGVGSLATSLVPKPTYIFGEAEASHNLRAVVRRGSVYRIGELPQSLLADDSACSTTTNAIPVGGPSELLEIVRVPRTLLPAYDSFGN